MLRLRWDIRLRLKSGFDVSGFSATNQVILNAMKNYGLILADIGSDMFITGAPDDRWDNDDLNQLKSVKATDFEVVQMGDIIRQIKILRKTLFKDCKKDFERQIYIKSMNMNSKILQLTALIILLLISFMQQIQSITNSRLLTIKQQSIWLPEYLLLTSTDSAVHIEGVHTDVEYLGKKWCYTDGQFSVMVPGKGGVLEVRRGPETIPVKISLDNCPAQK